MKERMNYRTANPGAFQVMLKLEGFAKASGIDESLYELIKIRASQINGCAYCLDMHTKDWRAMGGSEQRIYLLSAWREAPFYSEKERSVLELTEAVTRISDAGLPQHVYDKVRTHFDETEFVALLMVINTINCWNRLAISTGMIPGEYEPAIK
ncbi:MAG: carboxymuconolactone decarboxylase family protein [Paenibacillus sp.]|jgi:AhpD family alkylhydroperoxidase|nr:carboxymuconolactone decarboxylase family protein [Paenibacillus sp.]